MKLYLLSRRSGLAALWVLPCCLANDTLLPPATVLERQVVIIGDKRLILERITPPVPTMPLTPPLATGGYIPVVPLSLGCTVYGGLFTEIRWQDEAGGQYLIWSSLNLMPLSNGIRGHFDWHGTRYGIHLGLGEADAGESPGQQAAFSQITPPVGTGPWYAILQQPEYATAADYVGINALHLWFAENQPQLLAEQAAVRAANEAKAAAQAAQPVNKVTLMRFWPVQSVLHGAQPAPAASNSNCGEGEP